MSQIIFNSYIDLKNLGATPSGIGYTIAYDNDGILKQKDQDGKISPLMMVQSLEKTLGYGNYSGTYSIRMGTSSVINTINGTGRISLDYGSPNSVNISVTSSTITNTINNSFDGILLSSDVTTLNYYNTGTINLPIPDDSGYIKSDIFVPDSVLPIEILVKVNLSHTYLGDLILNLVSPSGKIINLYNSVLGGQDNFVNTVFSSKLTNPSITGNTGTWRWALGNVVGTAPYVSNTTNVVGVLNDYSYGTWSLVVADIASGDLGILHNWSIKFIVNDVPKRGSLLISSKTFSTYVGTTTYSTYIESVSENFSIGHHDSIVGVNGKINVIESYKTYDGVGSTNKASLHLNTFGATTSKGVANTVVIGGQYLTASKSNHVYLGNWVNVNNAYTLPNTDGLTNQILTTNGSGTVSWGTFSIVTPPLSQVLSAGNYSGAYNIVMHTGQNFVLGTNSSLSSIKSSARVTLDYNDNEVLIGADSSTTNGVIILGTGSLYTQADVYQLLVQTGSVTTSDLQGLKYSTDYTSTFVDNSLVSKKYVDTYGGGYQTNLVVYVDPVKGSDATGQINKPNLPYQTIAAAMIVIMASSYSSIDKGLIHLRKGSYTIIATLNNNIDYFCEPGVVFTSGGFSDINGAATSNVYGYASFISFDQVAPALMVSNASTINFYFDTIDVVQPAANIAGGNVTMYGRYIKSQCSTLYAIRLAGSTNFDLRINKGILGAYDVIKVEDSYSGITYIETPYIRSQAEIASGGLLSDTVHVIRVGSNVTGNITAKCEVTDLSLSSLGNNAAVIAFSGNLTIRGDVKGGKSYGLYLGNGGSGKITIDGDVTSDREAIYDVSDNIELKIENSLIKSEGLGTFTQSVYIGAKGSIYINNSTIYNGLANSSILKAESEESSIYIYNSLAYSPGLNGYLISCTFSDYVLGMHNLRSNKDNADNIIDLFDPSGFIYDTLLFVPNF